MFVSPENQVDESECGPLVGDLITRFRPESSLFFVCLIAHPSRLCHTAFSDRTLLVGIPEGTRVRSAVRSCADPGYFLRAVSSRHDEEEEGRSPDVSLAS